VILEIFVPDPVNLKTGYRSGEEEIPDQRTA
jgi:hypothetical protein